MTTKSWRDVIKVHPAADMFPLMSETELLELGEDVSSSLTSGTSNSSDIKLLSDHGMAPGSESDVGITTLSPPNRVGQVMLRSPRVEWTATRPSKAGCARHLLGTNAYL